MVSLKSASSVYNLFFFIIITFFNFALAEDSTHKLRLLLPGSIEDPNFEKYLIDNGIDTDHTLNGKMDPADALRVTKLNLYKKGIQSLAGIEMFENLQYLSCGGDGLEELDLRKNIDLREFHYHSGGYRYMLQEGKIHFFDEEPKLKRLDVSKCTRLTILECSGSEIETLDVSDMADLVKLDCMANRIKALNLRKAYKLDTLMCAINNLEELDLYYNSNLTYFYAPGNRLWQIDLSTLGQLKSLDLSWNRLSDIDVSQNLKLERLDVSNNEINLLAFNKNESLRSVHCRNCKTKTARLDLLPNLTFVDLSDNDISTVDFSNNTKLGFIHLHYCKKLSSLDLSKNVELQHLNCQYTGLHRLDLRKNPKITELSLAGTRNLEICVNDIQGAASNKEWRKEETAFYSKCY